MNNLIQKIISFLKSEGVRFICEEFLLPVPIALLMMFLFCWWTWEIVSVIVVMVFK